MKNRGNEFAPACRLVLGLVAISIMAFLFYLSTWKMAMIESGYAGLWQIRMENSPVDANVLEGMAERKRDETLNEGLAPEETLRYTGWTQRNSIAVSNLDLGRTVTADVIYFCGENSKRFQLMLPNGCAITEKMAADLWGTAKPESVVGRTIRVKDRDYIVEKLMLDGEWEARWAGCQIVARWDGEHSDIVSFDVLDVEGIFPGNGYTVEDILASENLKSSLIIGYDEILKMLKALRVLPVWAIALYLAAVLFLFARKNGRRASSGAEWLDKADKDRGSERTGEWLGGLSRTAGIASLAQAVCAVWGGMAILLLTAWSFGFPFSVPQSFIPTRWSDFFFWSRTMEGAGETLRDYMTMRLYGPDAYFKAVFFQLISIYVTQAVILLVSVISLRQPASRMAAGMARELWRLIRRHTICGRPPQKP